MKIKLSYIIPIFNGEKYLVRCLDSLFIQGLSNDEYEVICIDDCSKDGSVKILRDYASKRDNVHLILHEKNKRTSTSCNEGLLSAQGEYIWIIGQDDWIEPNWAKRILEQAQKENLDVVPFNYNRVNADGSTLLSNVEVFPNSPLLNGNEYVRKYFYDTAGIYLLGYEWRAIYRKQFLIDKGISFPQNVLFEDTTFLFKAIWYADKIKSVNEFIYNYRLNDKSVTDYEQRYKGYLTYEFSFKTSAEIIDLASQISDEHVVSLLNDAAKKSLKSFAYKVIPMSRSERAIFYDNVNSNRNDIIHIYQMLPWLYRLLLLPVLGKQIALCLKPIFQFRHLFVKRLYINK